jgi:hypothetical protein
MTTIDVTVKPAVSGRLQLDTGGLTPGQTVELGKALREVYVEGTEWKVRADALREEIVGALSRLGFPNDVRLTNETTELIVFDHVSVTHGKAGP